MLLRLWQVLILFMFINATRVFNGSYLIWFRINKTYIYIYIYIHNIVSQINY